MRIGLVTDTHIGARKFRKMSESGTNRFASATYDCLSNIKTEAQRQNLDILLILGDVFDTPNPSYLDVNEFRSFLTCLTDSGIVVYCLYGNHDRESRSSNGEIGPIEVTYKSLGLKNDWSLLPSGWTAMNYSIDKSEYSKQAKTGKVLLCHDEFGDTGINSNICMKYDRIYSGHTHYGGEYIIPRPVSTATIFTHLISPIGGKYGCPPSKMLTVDENGVILSRVELKSIEWKSWRCSSSDELKKCMENMSPLSVIEIIAPEDTSREEIIEMQSLTTKGGNIYTYLSVECSSNNNNFMKREIKFWDAVDSDRPSWRKELEEILYE